MISPARRWLSAATSIVFAMTFALGPILLLLGAQRLLFLRFLQTRHFFDGSFDSIRLALFNGLRFDLMIAGYLLLPLVFLYERFSRRFYLGLYLLLMATVIFLFLMELVYFDFYFDRYSDFGLSLSGFRGLFLAIDKDYFVSGLLAIHLLFFSLQAVLVLVILFYQNVFFVESKVYFGRKQSISSWVVLTLIAIVLARGSFGPYHLDLRHSQVSSSVFLNLSTLNTVYTFDQALRGRR